MIRKAVKNDINRLLEVYSCAKHYMHTHGNPNQWNGAYPDRATLEDDVEKGHLYAMYRADGTVYGCFALIGGEDPTYAYIEGKWSSSTPYGTIHRIAADGTQKGVFAECCDFARTMYCHLRVDTHEDNKTMQGAVKKYGFVYTGIIYLENGDPRLAYEWLNKD